MFKKLIINSNVAETRIALLEGDRVAELYIERHSKKGMVGNIYKGRVTRVLPGMQSAFVDIGVDRSAFLFGGDVVASLGPGGRKRLISPDGRVNYQNDRKENQNGDEELKVPIEEVVHSGHEIIVQVAKEPLGTKGPRVTMQLAIPGRYLVLMPDFENIGISRRIENEYEREEIRRRIESIKPSNMGIIARTAALGADIEVLQRDLDYLLSVWGDIKGKTMAKSAPTLLYQEPDLVFKTVRDLYSDEISEIVVDEQLAFSQLQHFLVDTIPSAFGKLKLYTDRNPIFDNYGIEMDIAKALSKKVWLPSGGYLVIDQTEALTSFDVNTGKFVGTKDVQETIYAANLEAAVAIAHQLRVRNLGGIIVLDFIDMEKQEHRDGVRSKLEEMLKPDKAKNNILAINELGLVHMTRKRTADSLERVMTEECPYCTGRGRVLTHETQSYEMFREVERLVIRTAKKVVKIRIRHDLKEWIDDNEMLLLVQITEKHGILIEFEVSDFNVEHILNPPYEVVF